MEFIPESDVSLLQNCNSILFEGEEINILERTDNIVVPQKANYYGDFLDKIIETKFGPIISHEISFVF